MVVEYNYKLELNKTKLVAFLANQNLDFDNNIDTCVVIRDNEKIVACACKKDNVFKMIAVAKEYQALDYVAKMITKLIEICYAQSVYHYFIFTKLIYTDQFQALGFKLLVYYQDIGLFEMGTPSFVEYYQDLVTSEPIDRGAIVMNCNPFTLGHRYLIASVASKVEQLIVFIVEENKSFFDFKDRINLVKTGVADLTNVIVIPSGPYIISQATFPTYFLKSLDSKAEYYTNIDILLFKKIMDKLNITKRFVGSEPIDKLTNYYNQQLLENLHDNLVVLQRKEHNKQVISASLVRKYLEAKEFLKIKEIVPNVTYDYLVEKYGGNHD